MALPSRSPSSLLSRRALIGGSLAGVTGAHFPSLAAAVPRQGGPLG